MLLIGQYDSPFVRRAAVALKLYDMPYEHRPWSTWADAERIAELSPLGRVPVLVLDDGEALLDSASILDFLDGEVGPERALCPARGPEQRLSLYVAALATGLADKAVSLFYERLLHPTVSDTWVARCSGQIERTLSTLESDRARQTTPYWLGTSIGHADIAVACALRFTSEAHPGHFDLERYPALAEHAARCETLAAFRAVVQPFLVKTA